MNMTNLREEIKEHGKLIIKYCPDIVEEISFFHIYISEDCHFKFYNILFDKRSDEFQDFLIYVCEMFNVDKKFVSYIKKLIQSVYQKQFQTDFQISNKEKFELIVEKRDLNVVLSEEDLITENLYKQSPKKNLTPEEIEQKQKKRELRETLKTSHPKISTRLIKNTSNIKNAYWCVKYYQNGYKVKCFSKNLYTFKDAVKYFEDNNEIK